MRKINCIIVDDNSIDRDYLQSIIVQYPDCLVCKGSFANALEAQEFMKQHTVELMFMDIDMPVINGMDYFKQLSDPPVCIFITAHSEYAWEGFEAQAFDYILKPVKKERFDNVINRLQEYISLQNRADLYDTQIGENTITIKEGYIKHVINVNDILYIEALKDYSKVVTINKKIMTLSKLKHFMDKLPQNQFLRIHRSYAIAKNKVSKLDTNELYIQNVKLPIGKTFKSQIIL